MWFRAVDNGSGKDSPDLISKVAFFSGPGIPCTEDTPGLPANIPIEAGNVTVH
jgi:hypothetical protein